MQTKILTDLTNYKEPIEEAKKDWLYQILYHIGVDVDELDTLTPDIAVDYLIKRHIIISDYPGMGALKVEYRRDSSSPIEVIGEWAGPDFILKRGEDGTLYYEVVVETWCIMDDSIETG
jgi:hypothetical protein